MDGTPWRRPGDIKTSERFVLKRKSPRRKSEERKEGKKRSEEKSERREEKAKGERSDQEAGV